MLFNDNDAYAADWLRNLYPDAVVDGRSISDLTASDVAGHRRVHLFAGIGGWEYALQLAGWSGPVWTGSCPCQPFSSAGKRKAEADERHLWPEFRRLIAECRPSTIFGEQVESKDGRRWLAGVRADLEAMGYRFGAADLCAASAGAPHIRQRLFWVADTGRTSDERGGRSCNARATTSSDEGQAQQRQRSRPHAGCSGSNGGLEHAASDGRIERWAEPSGRSPEPRRSVERVAYTDSERGCGGIARGGDATDARVAGQTRYWDAYDTLPMLDGKARRVRPGSFPLATGVPSRVAKLRAIGNSIVPQVAASFVRAYMEAR